MQGLLGRVYAPQTPRKPQGDALFWSHAHQTKHLTHVHLNTGSSMICICPGDGCQKKNLVLPEATGLSVEDLHAKVAAPISEDI